MTAWPHRLDLIAQLYYRPNSPLSQYMFREILTTCDRKLIVIVLYPVGTSRKPLMRKNTLETREVKHQAYLLHLWREEQDDVWRASVKTTTGEKEVAFASLDELFVYLLRRTEAN